MIESFLFGKQHSVVLNGQEFEWLTIKAGLPQDSFLDPLLYIYIYIYICIYIYILYIYILYIYILMNYRIIYSLM